MKYVLLLPLLLITACGVQTDLRQQTANHIARPAFMAERFILAENLKLQTWERMHNNGGEATLYIEGDSAIVGSTTPFYPVALELASRDNSKNLAYLGRPCQFIKMPQQKGCDSQYWTDELYSEHIITAYETALNDIIKTYNLAGLHLVGYDGGANIAAILTARNKNILSLRTVAGNLNPELTKTGQSNNALYAIDYGTTLATVPQVHFIGGLDSYITPAVYHSYRQALGLSDCVSYHLVPDVEHIHGWTEKWAELLRITPACAETYKDVPLPAPTPAEIPTTLYKDLTK